MATLWESSAWHTMYYKYRTKWSRSIQGFTIQTPNQATETTKLSHYTATTTQVTVFVGFNCLKMMLHHPTISFCWETLIARFMGPSWGPSGADMTQMGPMNFAIWECLSMKTALVWLSSLQWFNWSSLQLTFAECQTHCSCLIMDDICVRLMAPLMTC